MTPTETLAQEQAKSEQRVHQARRIRSGLPIRALPLLKAPLMTTAVQAGAAFLDTPASILVLSGGEGCGKTVAACVTLDRQMRTRCRPGLFVKAIDMARVGAFNVEFWADMRQPDILVIDDMGTEPLDEKGWALANIHALLDARYDDLTKTVITTNLPLTRFEGRYGQDGGRLLGRLRESGVFVEIPDASLRKGR
jgi:DNA replication protein DnaC